MSVLALIRFNRTVEIRLVDLRPEKINVMIVLTAIGLHLIGHWMRARNFQMLLGPVKIIPRAYLFKTLSIGYLFNSLLPLRFGELIKVNMIGKTVHISRIVVLLAVVIERLADILILVLGFLVLAILTRFSGINQFWWRVVGWMGAMFLVATLSIYVCYSQNKRFLRAVGQVARFFNESIKKKMMFSVWTLVYGINIMIRKLSVVRYLLSVLIMWLVYLTAVAMILGFYYENTGRIKQLMAALAAYLSVSIPSGPAFLGTYHYYFSNIVKDLAEKEILLSLSVFTWGLIIIPISLIGCWYLIFLNKPEKSMILGFLDSKDTNEGAEDNFSNKLFRYTDVSKELGHFLEEYFNGGELSRILSGDEIGGKLRVVRVIAGGSNAITSVVWSRRKKIIRKSVLSPYAEKLKNQYFWLEKRKGGKHIPEVLGFYEDGFSYSFDMKFYQDYIPFFDYIHQNSVSRSEKLIESIIGYLQKEIYKTKKSINSRGVAEKYIKEKVFNKLQDTISLNHELGNLVDYDKLVINGKSYLNFGSIMKKILKRGDLMDRLGKFDETTIHGDLTIENILARGKDFILLDPNDENLISDEVVDYAKLYQSLHSGYEFLCRLTSSRTEDNSVFFEENVSSKYTGLFSSLNMILKKKLDPKKMSVIKFHEAVHYFRLLTYKARLCPKTLPVFYATGIKLLNEFHNEN